MRELQHWTKRAVNWIKLVVSAPGVSASRAYSFLIEGALDWRMVSATSVERLEAMSYAPSGATPTAYTTLSRGERSCPLPVRGDPS